MTIVFLLFDNVMTILCLQCSYILILCCDNFAHVYNHVMTSFVLVFTQSVLTICEIMGSNLSWKCVCVCTPSCFDNLCSCFIKYVMTILCVYVHSSHFDNNFMRLYNQKFHYYFLCKLCIVWYPCFNPQSMFLCYLILML